MSDLQVDESTPERVLVVAAHPDDIEFGSAGSVAKWIRAGAHVTYALLTDGAAGSNDPDADLEGLVALRRTEQDAAAEVVGVTDVRYLGYPDGRLEANLDVRKAVTRLIREVKPDRVVCQDPETLFRADGYINHPDHRAAGLNTIYAVFPSAETRPAFPGLIEEGYEPHKVTELYMTLTNAPSVVVDITETFEDKIEALLKHESQLGDGEWAREAIGGWNREQGEPYGMQYAEAFRVIRLRQMGDDDEGEQTLAVETEGHAEEE